MPNTVTNRQMFFLLLITLTTYTVISIPQLMAENANTGSWVPLLFTTLVFAIAATIIVSLHNMFQGCMLLDYGQRIVGKFFAYAISLLYLLYFLTVGVFLNFELASVLKANFLFKTPEWATLLISIPAFGYIAYKGITNIARFIEIIGTIFIITAISVHLLMLTQGDIINIQPFFRASHIKEYIGTIPHTILPFLGIEILTVIPFTKSNGKKAKKVAFFTIITVGLFYILIVETCIMILGINNIKNYNYALIEAIELVEMPLVERADILYLTVGFLGLNGGVCVVYLSIVEYACKLFAKIKRIIIVPAVGILLFGLSFFAIKINQSEQFLTSVIPIAGIFTALIIPIILLLIAKVKKRASQNN